MRSPRLRCGFGEWDMRALGRFLGFLFATGAIVFVIVAAVAAVVIFKFEQDLPDYSHLKNYEPPGMTRVHAADGSLLAEYSRERRVYLPPTPLPPLLKSALLFAGDKNIFTHPRLVPESNLCAA